METITNEINILKTCKTCLEIKSISMFELKRKECRKCKSIKNNKVMKDKDYFKIKYIENKEYRSEYSKQLYQRKLLKNSLINI